MANQKNKTKQNTATYIKVKCMPIIAQRLESDKWKYKILKQKCKLKGSIIHKAVEY